MRRSSLERPFDGSAAGVAAKRVMQPFYMSQSDGSPVKLHGESLLDVPTANRVFNNACARADDFTARRRQLVFAEIFRDASFEFFCPKNLLAHHT